MNDLQSGLCSRSQLPAKHTWAAGGGSSGLPPMGNLSPLRDFGCGLAYCAVGSTAFSRARFPFPHSNKMKSFYKFNIFQYNVDGRIYNITLSMPIFKPLVFCSDTEEQRHANTPVARSCESSSSRQGGTRRV